MIKEVRSEITMLTPFLSQYRGGNTGSITHRYGWRNATKHIVITVGSMII